LRGLGKERRRRESSLGAIEMSNTADSRKSLREAVQRAEAAQLHKNVARKIWQEVRDWQKEPPQHPSERWVGELFQNAVDTAERCRNRLHVWMTLTETEFHFMHDGGPFQIDDLSALILAGSAKPTDNSSKGRFGTGFFVTHAISTLIKVAGKAKGEDGTSDFCFQLNRQGSEETIEGNIEQCYRDLEKECPVAPRQACFEYQQMTPEGHHIATLGLQFLDGVLPYLFAFNDCLDEVTVSRSSGSVTWQRVRESAEDADGVARRVIQLSCQDGGPPQEYAVHIFTPTPHGLVAAVVRGHDTPMLVPPGDLPRLYRFFPLVNSAGAGIPVVIHGDFDVNEARSADCLTKEASVNQERASAILNNVAPFLTFLASFPAGGPAAARLHAPTGALEKTAYWKHALQNVIEQLVSRPIVRCGHTLRRWLTPAACSFPVTSVKGADVRLDQGKFWDLLATCKSAIPPKADAPSWEEVILGWESLGVKPVGIWNVDQALRFTQESKTIDEADKRLQAVATEVAALSAEAGGAGGSSPATPSSVTAVDWVARLLELLAPMVANLPGSVLSLLRLPDQSGTFTEMSKLARDRNVDGQLKVIAGMLLLPLEQMLLHAGLLSPEAPQMVQQFLQERLKDEIDDNAAVKKLVEHVRARVRQEEASTKNYRWKPDHPLIEGAARLLVWIAMNSTDASAAEKPYAFFGQCADDLPLLTEDGTLLLPEKTYRCLPPAVTWAGDGSHHRFKELFPAKRRLAEVYHRVASENWPALAKALNQARICHRGPVIGWIKGTLKGKEVKALLREQAEITDDAEFVCSNYSDIPFLEQEVIGRISQSVETAKLFVSFLLTYVAHNDARWKETADATPKETADATPDAPSATVKIRPSKWLAHVLRDHWVPNPDRTADQKKGVPAGRESLHPLISWADLSDEPAELELLGLLGFDRLEVWLESRSDGDEEEKQRLRDQVMERLNEEAEAAKKKEDEDRLLEHYLENIIQPVYLPFTGNELLRHFAPAAGKRGQDLHRHLRYYVRSASNYANFDQGPGDPERLGASLQELKRPCQIEKDERFWLATCLMKHYYAQNRVSTLRELMLSAGFPEKPPVAGLADWEDCFTVVSPEHLHLFFEVHLPSPPEYKNWLRRYVRRQHFIPYVLDAAHHKDGKRFRAELEKRTHADALLLNEENGFAVLFEGKVLSDCSYQIEYDVTRNQLARNIDVLLPPIRSRRAPLTARDPSRTLFVLLTPEVFRRRKRTRLYGYLLRRYQSSPEALRRALRHREDVTDWADVSRRIGWLTWEDSARILPASCPWLQSDHQPDMPST
jgi:hypothetical protein